MIKCNRCGNVNIAGAVHCQSCGSALSSIDASGSHSNVTSQDKSVLPAWLETLRVGERPPRPASNAPQFSPTDLIEEGSLPSWMHAQRNETQNVTGANMPVSMRSSTLPAPITDNTPFPATSITAQSLIDEKSLPSWMQDGQAPASLPAKDGTVIGNRAWIQEGQVYTPFPSESQISTEDLVEKESVPDWMKSLQQQSGGSGLRQPKQPTGTEGIEKKVEPLSLSSSPTSGFAARDLVDQQSLPPWLTQLGKQAPTTSASHDQLGQSSTQNEQSRPISPGQKKFAARDLIDQKSLPSWMVQPNSEPARQSSQPGGGLPASSLLDMNALPSWLTQNGQVQTGLPASSPPPGPVVPPNQSWPPQQPTAQGSLAASSSEVSGHMAMDANAFP